MKLAEIVSNDPMDYVMCALAIETLAYHNKRFLCCQSDKLISEQVQALLKEAIKKVRCRKMTIGENIRKIRKARGLTLKQLAEMSGYYYQHLHHIETSNHIPKVSTAIDIADVLEVSLDELVGREFKKVLKPVEKFPFDYCPKCDSVVNQLNKHCPHCGQALDWSDTE